MTPPKLLPPHYFLLSMVLMVGLGLIDNSDVLPALWRFSGLLPLVIGIWLAVEGSRRFADAGTNIIPFTESTALVTSGVFAFSRNPMYTGMILILAGTALLLNGWLPWILIPIFIGIIRTLFIRHEERLMAETFGDEYLAYKTRVRRWL